MNRKSWLHTFRVALAWIVVLQTTQTRAGADESQPPSTKTEVRNDAVTERPENAAVTHRAIYFARNSSSETLVTLLEKHFDGDSGVRIVAEPNANLMSIRANSPAALEEVLKTLAQIDRPLRQVVIQVLQVEFNARKEEGADADGQRLPVNTDELTGSATEVLAKVRSWIVRGQVAGVRRYELKAIENNSSQLFLGEQKPVVTAYTTNGTSGVASPVVTTRDLGTMIEVSPRITEAGGIDLTLQMQSSHLLPPDRGVELTKKGEAGPLVTRATATTRLATSLLVANGKSNVATGFDDGANSGHAPSLFVISAQIVEPNNVRASAIGSVRLGERSFLTTSRTPETSQPQESVSQPPVVSPRDGRNEVTRFVIPPSLSRELRNEAFAKRMNLTEEQRQKLAEIDVERRDFIRSKAADLRGGGVSLELTMGLSGFERKSVDLLTDEQKEIWAERVEELKSPTKVNP